MILHLKWISAADHAGDHGPITLAIYFLAATCEHKQPMRIESRTTPLRRRASSSSVQRMLCEGRLTDDRRELSGAIVRMIRSEKKMGMYRQRDR